MIWTGSSPHVGDSISGLCSSFYTWYTLDSCIRAPGSTSRGSSQIGNSHHSLCRVCHSAPIRFGEVVESVMQTLPTYTTRRIVLFEVYRVMEGHGRTRAWLDSQAEIELAQGPINSQGKVQLGSSRSFPLTSTISTPLTGSHFCYTVNRTSCLSLVRPPSTLVLIDTLSRLSTFSRRISTRKFGLLCLKTNVSRSWRKSTTCW